MCFYLKEVIYRSFYCFFSFFVSLFIFVFFSAVWLEFIVVSFDTSASGVFFCLDSLITRSVSVRIFLGSVFVVPFLLFQFSCYILPSLYWEEQFNFIFICFFTVSNFILGIAFCWYYLLPLFYFAFVSWFRGSGLAITFIPEVIALTAFVLFILLSFSFILQLPSLMFTGIFLGFWCRLSLGVGRTWFYLFFLLISTLLSPPEFWVQFTLIFVFAISFELTLLVACFFFVSKAFYL